MQSKLVEALAVGELSWQDYANCRGADADLFFPERGASTRKAKAICGACEVKAECLDYAVDMGEKFGIWPGTYNSVYGEGWLRDFFQALTDNQDWIHSVTYADYLEKGKAAGRTYLRHRP